MMGGKRVRISRVAFESLSLGFLALVFLPASVSSGDSIMGKGKFELGGCGCY
jgi:hypothetical protein